MSEPFTEQSLRAVLEQYQRGQLAIAAVYGYLNGRPATELVGVSYADTLLLYLFELDPPNPFARTEDGFRRLVQGAIDGTFEAAEAEFWTPDWTAEAEATA